ncbi:MAG: sugar transporter, partial [Sulfolobales archaeon]
VFFGVVFYPFGAVAAWFSEGFPTKYRYTGTGLSYQFGGLLSGLISSLVPPLIILLTNLPISSLWIYYAVTYTIICIVSAISTFIYSELAKKILPLQDKKV